MSLWDPHQREWLQAMGLAPLSLAGRDGTDADAPGNGTADAPAVDAGSAPAVAGTRAAPVSPESAAPQGRVAAPDAASELRSGRVPPSAPDFNPDDGALGDAGRGNSHSDGDSRDVRNRADRYAGERDGAGRNRDDGEPAAPTDMATRLAALDSARAGGARGEGPLWDALLRATRQSPALAARSLREFGVDPVALREDAAAKRALWPRLRRLRAGRRG